MKKRWLSLLLALVMVLGLLPGTVWAADPADALQTALAESQDYTLVEDVTLPEDWAPADNFSGTLDGAGYTITLAGKPVFDTLAAGGVVKNLVLEGSVSDSGDVGALANQSGGTIRNCYSSASVKSTKNGYVGGFVGKITGGSIANCLSAFAGLDNRWDGGIVGAGTGSSTALYVQNCYWVSGGGPGGLGGGVTDDNVDDRSKKVTAEDDALAALLNACLEKGDLTWGLTEGVLLPGGVPSGGGSGGSEPTTPEEPEGGLVTAANQLLGQTSGNLTLGASFALPEDWEPAAFSGTLDGSGYTITLSGAPLFDTLEAGGAVTNLLLDGEVAATGGNLGALAKQSGGTIRNCFTSAGVSNDGYAGVTGGLVGRFTEGTIQNCLAAGTMRYKSSGDCGGIAGVPFGNSNKPTYGAISNCYWTATPANAAPYIADMITNSQKVAAADLNSAYLAALLNSNLPEGDLKWGVTGNTLVPGGTGTPAAADKTALHKTITEVQNLTQETGPYTDDTWTALQTALTAARAVAGNVNASQAEVDKALADLSAAVEGLEKNLSASTNRNALRAAIADAGTVTGFYTRETWAAFEEALATAQETDEDVRSTQEAINAAASALTNARKALAVRTLPDLTPPAEEEIIEIATAEEFYQLLDDSADGQYYRLTEDIQLYTSEEFYGQISYFWEPPVLNAVLDGNGHTVTLMSAPETEGGKGIDSTGVFSRIGETGAVLNLGVAGKAASRAYGSGMGAIAGLNDGLIFNCWSRADLENSNDTPTGGLVGTLGSGGAILNSWAAGRVTGAAAGLAGMASGNSQCSYSYWLQDMGEAVGEGTGQQGGCDPKSRKDFYSDAFIALLNDHRETAGLEWGLSEQGYPYHGEDQTFTPPDSLTLTFTPKGGGAYTFDTLDGLTLSIFDVDESGYPGTLSYPADYEGKVLWENAEYASGGNNPIMVAQETGALFVTGAGSAVLVAKDADSQAELARFTVRVTEGQVAALRLTVDGQDASDLTVQGSELVTLTPQVQLAGEGQWRSLPYDLFTFSDTGEIIRYNNMLRAKAPGVMTVTAKGYGLSATAKITSEYVAVESIRPLFEGAYTLHDRNANSNGMGDFLDLKLDNRVSNNVVVKPENASYKDAWTLTSSDESVAKYVESMIDAVLPYKPGTTTLTALSKDPGLQAQVSGSTTISLSYFNPVTALTTDSTALTVAENAVMDLPLTFTGPKTEAGYHVSEAGMEWDFSSDNGGQVEIYRDTSGLLLRQSDPDEYCISNFQYKLAGVTAGTVTATGTPVDKTNTVTPIVFTITVTPGQAEEPADIPTLLSEAIPAAQLYVKTSHTGNYKFGDEWDVFSLARSGSPIDTEQAEAYLSSVETTYQASLDPDRTEMKPTTLARVTLALGVLGQDASDFRGLDFIGMLVGSGRMDEGSNEPMWTLIALDSLGYAVPEGAVWTREKLITELISKYQNQENGGFGLNDNVTVGVDITAMSIQALARYRAERTDVQESIDKALAYLRSVMTNVCGFEGNVESAAQVLVALATLDMNPLDTENGFARSAARNIITNILSFRDAATGGFKHTAADQGPMPMSAMQALYSLNAYQRFAQKENHLYDLTDVNPKATLKARLTQAEALQETDYTKDTWAALVTAMTAARTTLDNPAASDAELKSADTALAAALAGLAPVNPGPGPDRPSGDTITVSFRMVGDLLHNAADQHDTYINWIKTFPVEIPKDGTVYDAFAAALAEKGMGFEEGQHSYISRIQAPAVLGGYWLGEFDNGSGSGWKYLVNGKYPGVGLRYYWLEDGDSVIWRYVDDYTDSHDNIDKWQEAGDVEPSASTPPDGSSGTGGSGAEKETTAEINPEITADSSGAARAEIGAEAVAGAIAQAKANNAASITIAPQITGDATSVIVELPKSAAQSIVNDTSASLNVETNAGTVSIPNDALASITQQAKGSDIQIAAETKTAEDVKDHVAEADLANAVIVEITVKSGNTAITSFGGKSLTIDLPVDGKNHVEGESYKVIVISADGTVSETAGRCVKVGGKLVVRTITTHLSTFVVTTQTAAPVLPFTDVEGHWAHDAITYAYNNGLMNGTGDTLFSPNATLNRAMLAAILYRMENTPAVTAANSFTDVAAGTWYTDAVIWASENGIVSGVGDGKFVPTANITREQMATMLYNYAKYKAYDVSEIKDLSTFADAGAVSAWALEAVQWANGSGLITGRTATTIAPGGTATRAEAATILMRFAENAAK